MHLVPEANQPRLKRHPAVARRKQKLSIHEVVVLSLPYVLG